MFIIQNGLISNDKSIDIGKDRIINLVFKSDLTFADDDKFKLVLGSIQSENYAFVDSGCFRFSYVDVSAIITKASQDISVKVTCNGSQILADSISFTAVVQGGGSGEVENNLPFEYNPTWWNIKQILENDLDAKDSAQSFIILINDVSDTLKLSQGTPQTIWAKTLKLSDGSIYNVSQLPDYSSTPLLHYWDKSKDLPCNQGYSTRYIIGYSDQVRQVSSGASSYITTDSIWQYWKNCKTTVSDKWIYYKYYLRGVQFLNCDMFVDNIDHCYSLRYYGSGNSYDSNVYNLSTSIVYADSCSLVTEKCYSLAVVNRLSSGYMQQKQLLSGCSILYEIKNIDVEIYPGSTSSYTINARLNHRSKILILNALKDLTGLTTKTLTFVNGISDLTDQEKAIATNKNWTIG